MKNLFQQMQNTSYLLCVFVHLFPNKKEKAFLLTLYLISYLVREPELTVLFFSLNFDNEYIFLIFDIYILDYFSFKLGH